MKLTPFTSLHFGELSRWFGSERDVVLWVGPTLTFPVTAPQLDRLLDESRAEPTLRSCWMAEHGSDLVGHVQLRYDWLNGNATITGVAIAPNHRGRGLAAPMLRAVIAEAFARPQIERLELNVFTSNAVAVHLYQRLGFVGEGVRRSCIRVGQERWDLLAMSMLRAERLDLTE